MIKIASAGAGATTGASSATIAIPNDGSGSPANRVIVTVQGATYVTAGSSSATATTGDVIVNAGSPLVLDTHGQTHIAHLQLTAAQRITVTPVETIKHG
jgi:hypothetical protein